MFTKYVTELRKKVHSGRATEEEKLLFSYAQAYRKGAEALRAFRGRLIAREINAVHDKDAQLAILFNKDSEPAEHEAYQAFRIKCKAKADATMARLKAELEEKLI